MFGLSTFSLIMVAAGAFFYLVWVVFFAMGRKHNGMFSTLEEKDYPLKEIYGWGYAFLEMIHYGYKSKRDRKLRQQLEVLYGEKYSEYYVRVIHSQQVTFCALMFVASFAFYGLAADVAAFVVGLVFSGLSYYYYGTMTQKRILQRSDELIHDFSEVVSKLALLTNAGMILREAWAEVAFGADTVLYKEMQTAVDEMNNGVAEVDAIYGFGMRCMLPEIKKFSSTIIQGLTKGNSELAAMLQDQSKEVWQMKKQLVRREGEKAASKLLIPICIMFLGILIMILVPIFTNIGT